MKRVCVVGLGYIGLPTAAIFAKHGYEVVGVDIDKTIVQTINEGDIHIEEDGLRALVKAGVKDGNLRARTSPEKAEVFIITVPTPVHADKTVNLGFLEDAVRSIVPYVEEGNIVIVESTIPPRTMDDVVAPIFSKAGWNVGDELYLAHCPERVLPGRILYEIIHNTRIIGGINKRSADKSAEIYQTFVKGKIKKTSALSAEMAKLMENTYRDVNIALANELVKISGKLGVDALEVIQLANNHPRVNIHQPGPGVGGHCIPVDPYFIMENAPNEVPLIANARKINNSMPAFVVSQVTKLVNRFSKIAIFGLAYKGNVNDVRESPAIEVVKELSKKNYRLAIYDPHVKEDQVDFHLTTFDEAVSDAECLLVLTDHDEFKKLDEEALLTKMKSAVILDTKNCVKVNSASISYFNFGNISEAGLLEAALN